MSLTYPYIYIYEEGDVHTSSILSLDLWWLRLSVVIDHVFLKSLVDVRVVRNLFEELTSAIADHVDSGLNHVDASGDCY